MFSGFLLNTALYCIMRFVPPVQHALGAGFTNALLVGFGLLSIVVAAGFISDQYIEWGNMAATGVIAVVPVVILMTVAQKHFVQGLTMGAVKG